MGCSDVLLGNGSCDRACAVPDCNYDEGDCGDAAGSCAPGCMPAWLGDGQCQEECEVIECKFDDGDCPNWDKCPLNWGYPCACDLSRSRCDDGTRCERFSTGGKYAMCMKPCEYVGGLSDCDQAHWGLYIPFGLPACIFDPDGDATNGGYCGILCRYYDVTMNSSCPPGTHCMEAPSDDDPDDAISYCAP
jgi:hypothetical protein